MAQTQREWRNNQEQQPGSEDIMRTKTVPPILISNSHPDCKRLKENMVSSMAKVAYLYDHHLEIKKFSIGGLGFSSFLGKAIESMDDQYLLMSKDGGYLSVRAPVGETKHLITVAATSNALFVVVSSQKGKTEAMAKVQDKDLMLYNGSFV